MEGLNFLSKTLETNGPAVVHIPRDAPPGIQTIQYLCALEDGLRRARERRRHEAPKRRVDVHDLFLVEAAPDGVHELLMGDRLHVAFLRPLQDVLEERRPGDDVALELTFPLDSSFNSIESEFRLKGQFLVEDASILVPNGSKGSTKL